MGGLLGALGRNRAFAWQLAALAAVTAALAWGCGVVWGSAAGWGCALGGGAACVLFAAFSARRYGEVGRLAAQVDEVLERGRRLELARYREGDVAVLGNEVAKVVARLARATDQLEQEKRLMGDWMADVSHQIRTPLTAIALTADAIERAEGAAERKALLRQLESMVDQLSWLVTALLRLAKLDAGALPLESRPMSCETLVRDAAAPLEVALDLRGVGLDVRCQPGAQLVGDRRWMAEALGNVLKNCMEHTAPGGTITVEATEDALAFRLRVVDDGPGFASEDLPHVFDRFYCGRSDAAPPPSPFAEGPVPSAAEGGPAAPNAFNDGFGIGLSLARSLVAAQGGTLRASNDAVRGACFDFTFPKLNV